MDKKSLLSFLPILLMCILSQSNANSCTVHWSKTEFFTNQTYKTDQVDRQIMLYESSSMSKSESESTFGLGIDLPLPDLPIGLNYSESDYQSWAQSVLTSSQYNSYRSNRTEILKNGASKEALAAYKTCLKSRGGLDADLEDNGSIVTLELVWYQPPTGAESVTLYKPEIANGKIMSTVTFPYILKNNTPLILQVLKNDSTKSLVATINSSGGGAKDILPGQLTPRKIEPRIWWNFSSAATPGLFFRHYNSLAIAGGVQNIHYKGDIRWKFVPRGSDQNGLRIALESFNLPNYFLRHMNSRVRVNFNDGNAIMYSDSTFYYKKPLNSSKSSDCFSMEASNFPGLYVRQRPNGEIWIDRFDGSLEFIQQATICKTPHQD